MTQSNSLYSHYRVKSEDGNGAKIKEIYCIGDNYIIYKTDEKGLFKYQHNLDNLITAAIEERLFEAILLLKTKQDKNKFLLSIVAALKLCLEDKIENSKNLFDIIIVRIKDYIKVKNTIEYLIVCIIVVLICIVISSVFYNKFQLNSTISRLSLIAAAGSIGGFLSISLRIKDIINEVFENKTLNLLSATIRMMFSILTGIVTYFFIRSNIIFGFLQDKEINFFVILTLSVATGFFEKKLPEILKKLK